LADLWVLIQATQTQGRKQMSANVTGNTSLFFLWASQQLYIVTWRYRQTLSSPGCVSSALSFYKGQHPR